MIVGVAEVVSEGTDNAQMLPMVEQNPAAASSASGPPNAWSTAGTPKHEAIDEEVEAQGTQVFAPVPRPRKVGIDPYARKREDTNHTADWRARMNTDEARQIYKLRAAVAEPVHADLRNWRGLGRLPVRGRNKVRAVALLMALTYNVLRAPALLRAAAPGVQRPRLDCAAQAPTL